MIIVVFLFLFRFLKVLINFLKFYKFIFVFGLLNNVILRFFVSIVVILIFLSFLFERFEFIFLFI